MLLMIFFNQDCAHCSHQRFFIGEDSKHAETTLLPVLQKVSRLYRREDVHNDGMSCRVV